MHLSTSNPTPKGTGNSDIYTFDLQFAEQKNYEIKSPLLRQQHCDKLLNPITGKFGTFQSSGSMALMGALV